MTYRNNLNTIKKTSIKTVDQGTQTLFCSDEPEGNEGLVRENDQRDPFLEKLN